MSDLAFMQWTSNSTYPSNPSVPQGMRSIIVHHPDEEYPFLHDTMVTAFDGRILMGWYNCSEAEIVGKTLIRGRWSCDNGLTWSSPEIISQDTSDSGIHLVPVTFANENNRLYAITTRMSSHDRPIGYQIARYHDGNWETVATYNDPLLFNTLPQRLSDGRWMASGRMSVQTGELPLIPVVVTAEFVCDRWTITPLPGPWNEGIFPLLYPETALLNSQRKMQAITRNDTGKAQLFLSNDLGINWNGPFESKLPIAPSKIYGGTLSDGRQYLLYNELNNRNDRSRLVLAIRPHENASFDSLYLISEGFNSKLNCGPQWHYPCACEADGMLHVSCTSSANGPKRHGVLFSIPVNAL